MKFYVGLHQPSDARHVRRAFVSINRLRTRKKPLGCEWMLDSGAFTELATYGHYRHEVADYAAQINRLANSNPGLVAAVAQDYMCEPFILTKTGLTVAEHQRLTIERYDALVPLTAVTVMPVLQGYHAHEYVAHIAQYGERLKPGMLVGVGSICKRNGNPRQIEIVLGAIKNARPDLRLHGFGLKQTALASGLVRKYLYSADSMAWSFAARRQKRNQNDVREAIKFAERIETMPCQHWLF